MILCTIILFFYARCMQVEPKEQNQISTYYVKLFNDSGVDIKKKIIEVATSVVVPLQQHTVSKIA